MPVEEDYVIGIDYGTDSVRSVLVDTKGNQLADAVFDYPRWAEGKYCDSSSNQFRHHPLDYLEGLEETLKSIVNQVPLEVVQRIKGISVDSTGSTPVAVDKEGTPLALLENFAENPNAMFILWKDHTSVHEAAEITDYAKSWGGPDYSKYVGGIYSSEWFWAKILHTLRNDENIRESAYSWVELCDWISFELTGQNDIHKMKRSRCAAGHKAMWHEEFGGLPAEEFLTGLDPLLAGLRDRLYQKTYTADQPAGEISNEWAEKLGLPKDVVIGVGSFDAHMGAVGGEIEPYFLSRVMGTSTCDILVAPSGDMAGKRVNGICGQVDGSVIPGMIGLEAGQSGFGDVYAWFKEVLMWPLQNIVSESTVLSDDQKEKLLQEVADKIIPEISNEAAALEVKETDIIALDWHNGRRTPDANQLLKGAIKDLDLSTDAPKIFKALVEATCFGAKAIVQRFRDEGIPIKGIIGLGGVAKKSPYIMQTLADVLNMPIKIAKSEQSCALGAAMFAATAAGLFESVRDASKAMGSGFGDIYHPNQKNVETYDKLYQKYISFGKIIEEQIENHHPIIKADE
ncbi:MAG: ribulokinase [Balneolaceae bacterium]